MVTIQAAHGGDFSRVYPLLLEFNNQAISKEQWRQLFVDHSGLQNDQFGWMLLDGDQVVGFLATTLSERVIRGERLRLCNTSNWIVKSEYRVHSLALCAKALAEKDAAITNLSPTPQVLKLLEKFGFSLMDKSERIILPVVTLRTFTDRSEVITRPRDIEQALVGESLKLFRDHQLPYHRHALLRAPEGECYLMMNRSLKAIGGSLRLPFARIHHISEPEIFTRHTEMLAARIATSFGVVALIVDARMLRGRTPWHSFAREGGVKKAAFRSDRLTEHDIDGLYTEAVLLNY